jgi:hypothetical protein
MKDGFILALADTHGFTADIAPFDYRATQYLLIAA